MAEAERIEVVPTDRFPSVLGVDPDHIEAWGVVGCEAPARDANGRWSGSLRSTLTALSGGRPNACWSRSVTTWTTTFGGATFLRMIEVPGGRLAVTLAAWWRQHGEDDDHLHFASPHHVDGAWLLEGALKTGAFARAIPVELSLCPYLRWWTRLELMPRRTVQPNQIYFREGNGALDRFVAAIRAQDVLMEAYEDSASEPRSWRP
jgi:hypothetical protein